MNDRARTSAARWKLSLWPAIDLRGGRVVRLLRGELSKATFYDGEPAEIARRFEAEGADGIHVVDLDAAFGIGGSREAVKRVLGAVRVPVEVGGGIRTREDADALLSAGAARLVLGSALFGPLLVGALDCKDGRPTVRGWTEDAGAASAAGAARSLAALGISALLVTDVARDGAMEGPNLALLASVRAVFSGEVLASGGIRGAQDLGPVADALAGGPAGVVVGRAIHDGATSVAALVAVRGAEVVS